MSTTPFHPKITVDRTSDVPLYSQIAEALATLILDGTLAPGTRIEDEVSMARRLRCRVRPPDRRSSVWSIAGSSRAVAGPGPS